jgi:proteasome lid subunit RPN8/RPN11
MRDCISKYREHWLTLRKHVSNEAPLEACGMLAGVRNRVEAVLPVHNVLLILNRFRMDSREQYYAFDWIETNGPNLIGIYHSHPNGPLTVSLSDIAESAYEVGNIIWSQVADTWKVKGFWIESACASEVSIQVIDSE